MINDSEYDGIKAWKDMAEAKQDSAKLAAGLVLQVKYTQNLTNIIKKLMAGNYKQFTPEDLDIMVDIKETKLQMNTTKQTCQWMQADEDSNTWAGECGIEFNLENDTPEANGMIYCPKCGKLIDSVEG